MVTYCPHLWRQAVILVHFSSGRREFSEPMSRCHDINAVPMLNTTIFLPVDVRSKTHIPVLCIFRLVRGARKKEKTEPLPYKGKKKKKKNGALGFIPIRIEKMTKNKIVFLLGFSIHIRPPPPAWLALEQ